jgi:hypothetical protein
VTVSSITIVLACAIRAWTVDPDRHACSRQRLDTVCRRARCGLVGDQPNINPASSGAYQRLDDARASSQAIGCRRITASPAHKR